MRRVGITPPTVARRELYRFAADRNPERTGGDVNVFDRALRVRGKRPYGGARWNHIAQEFHFASGDRGSEVLTRRPSRGIGNGMSLGASKHADASGRWRRCVDERRERDLEGGGTDGKSRHGWGLCATLDVR